MKKAEIKEVALDKVVTVREWRIVWPDARNVIDPFGTDELAAREWLADWAKKGEHGRLEVRTVSTRTSPWGAE